MFLRRLLLRAKTEGRLVLAMETLHRRFDELARQNSIILDQVERTAKAQLALLELARDLLVKAAPPVPEREIPPMTVEEADQYTVNRGLAAELNA